MDPFTAKAGGCLLLVLAAGFTLFATRALVTGCIRLKRGPHDMGVLHCRPVMPYWVASMSLLLLGSALAFVCFKLFEMSRRRPDHDRTKY